MISTFILLLEIYSLVSFIVLICSILTKNNIANLWYLRFNIGCMIYLGPSIIFNTFLTDGHTIGSVIMTRALILLVAVLSIIGIIVNLIKKTKNTAAQTDSKKSMIFCLAALIVPIPIMATAIFSNNIVLKDADLVLTYEYYSGFNVARRTETIVSENGCVEQDTLNNPLIFFPLIWRLGKLNYWRIEEGKLNFKHDYDWKFEGYHLVKDYDSPNLTPTSKQMTDMQAIFNAEIGDNDPTMYDGAIETIDDTNYYIASIREITAEDSYGKSTGPYLYRNQQRICKIQSLYSASPSIHYRER